MKFCHFKICVLDAYLPKMFKFKVCDKGIGWNRENTRWSALKVWVWITSLLLTSQGSFSRKPHELWGKNQVIALVRPVTQAVLWIKGRRTHCKPCWAAHSYHALPELGLKLSAPIDPWERAAPVSGRLHIILCGARTAGPLINTLVILLGLCQQPKWATCRLRGSTALGGCLENPPLPFQDSGYFYSSSWQDGNIGKNEICSISFLKAPLYCHTLSSLQHVSQRVSCDFMWPWNQKLRNLCTLSFFFLPFVNLHKNQTKINADQIIVLNHRNKLFANKFSRSCIS